MGIFRLSLWILLIGIVSINIESCTYYEGEIGPQGPEGEQGPPGPPGLKGPKGTKGETSNMGTVYYSDWNYYTEVTQDGDWYVVTIPAPQLTPDNIDSVMVYVFYNTHYDTPADRNSYTYSLPYKSASSTVGNFVYPVFKPGNIFIYSTYNNAKPAYGFRYVIVPLAEDISFSARKYSTGDESNGVSYSKFCKSYNIPK